MIFQSIIDFFKGIFIKEKSNNIVQIPLEPKFTPVPIIVKEAPVMSLPDGIKDLVTKKELLAAGDPVAPEHESNFTLFHTKINVLRNKTGIPMSPSSFYRSKDRQIKIYKDLAANKQHPFPDGIFDINKVPMGSCHLQALAGDFSDTKSNGYKNVYALRDWVLTPENLLWCSNYGYYFEDFAVTIDAAIAANINPRIHVQVAPPLSGNVIFKP